MVLKFENDPIDNRNPTSHTTIILNKSNRILMSRPKTIRCEDAMFLMSRHLDGDISKEETWQIHNHSNSCPDCQVQMEEMAAIELEVSRMSSVPRCSLTGQSIQYPGHDSAF